MDVAVLSFKIITGYCIYYNEFETSGMMSILHTPASPIFNENGGGDPLHDMKFFMQTRENNS
jgi:hypothetical protein